MHARAQQRSEWLMRQPLPKKKRDWVSKAFISNHLASQWKRLLCIKNIISLATILLYQLRIVTWILHFISRRDRISISKTLKLKKGKRLLTLHQWRSAQNRRSRRLRKSDLSLDCSLTLVWVEAFTLWRSVANEIEREKSRERWRRA